MTGGLFHITSGSSKYISFSSFLLAVTSFSFMLKVAPGSTATRRRRAWSESDDDEQLERTEMQGSDGEVREDGKGDEEGEIHDED